MTPVQYKRALFIFRRDLRLEDNTSLITALETSKRVMPCFIVDPRQVEDQPYRGRPSLAFMISSLNDLKGQLKERGGRLFIFHGKPQDVVESLIQQEGIDAVFFNADYTPFSRKRDNAITDVCAAHKIPCHVSHDALLNPPDAVRKNDGGFYTVYTPYARKAMTIPVAPPRACPRGKFEASLSSLENTKAYDALRSLAKEYPQYPGGRTAALSLLSGIKQLKEYDHNRDFPFLQQTTALSAHHKFGTCSARETYHHIVRAFGASHTLVKELYWRDFFTQIGYHYPHVLGQSFYPRYDRIKWEDNEVFFQAWTSGQTGFPIVDAGMRELNATGFMHNRVRMITASFLIKDLHIDWRRGEKYFAQHLVDYDPLVNNGNWQWAASTGCDAAPYFRIFNPWLQQKRFDPQAKYIKQWIPSLKNVPAQDIHDIGRKGLSFPDFPAPIVWHEHEKAKTLAAYGKV